MEQCAFYCLNFRNPERKDKMSKRMEKLGLSCNFYEGVEITDARITKFTGIMPESNKRVLSYTYGHFDMVKQFASQSEKEYGIFCEDDVFIHKNFSKEFQGIISTFKSLDLDLLLLGYLTPFPIEPWNPNFKMLTQMGERRYHAYHDEQWGAQMYMMSIKQARYLIDKYYETDYLERSLKDSSLTPFSSDWIITKDARNRALVYPMYAVEEGVISSNDPGYVNFHQACHSLNYIPEMFY